MRRFKNAVLIIDAQIDFCAPNRGALYVDGAEKDNTRIANWMRNNLEELDYVSFTLDSHHINDISHPSMWMDKDGNMPKPFTPISYADIQNGIWTPRAGFDKKRIMDYVQTLEQQGEFGHFIWPYHCIIGTEGAALDPQVSEVIAEWSRKTGRFFKAHTKGTNPYTEHFGAFRAQVPDVNDPDSALSMPFIQVLEKYENVFFMGQAKSHCVATTLKQALNEAPNLAQKFVIIEDAMSNVAGGPQGPNGPSFGELAQPIYDEAKKRGIRFAKTTDIVLTAAGAMV